MPKSRNPPRQDQYPGLRPARSRHPHSDRPDYWLGRTGALSAEGIRQMVERRASRAGVERIHLHQIPPHLRPRPAGRGGQEHDLMRPVGWHSPAIVGRNSASAADQRALDAIMRNLM
jgi:integrase/recombinase XerC